MNENEQKKAYLKSYSQKCLAIKLIEDEIAEIRLSKMCPSVSVDGMPHGNNHSDLSRYAAVIDQQERRLLKAKYERIKVFSDIIQKIEEMDNELEKNILRLKYIHLKTWEEVCVEMKYSWREIHRKHNNALRNFKMA